MYLALCKVVLLIIFVVCQIDICKCDCGRTQENEDEVLESDRQKEVPRIPCEEEVLMEFLAQIQAINPESIVNIATKDTVDKTCKRLHEHSTELRHYLATCEPPHGPDLYMDLLGGVQVLQNTLCDNKRFQNEYRKHMHCLMELTEEFDDCTGPADWEEHGDRKKICKVFEKVSNCFYIKAATMCGRRAARTMKTLLVAVIQSVVKMRCENVVPDPYVADVMPEQPICAGVSVVAPLLLLLLLTFAVTWTVTWAVTSGLVLLRHVTDGGGGPV